MGDIHHPRRIHNQAVAFGLLREGTVNRPEHDGKAQNQNGDQRHPAHRAGDTDHGVKLLRRAEFVKS